MATSITLITWSAWRLVEAKWLLKCFPFHKINGALIIGAVIIAILGREFTQDHGLYVRIPVAGLGISLLMGLALWYGREPEDDDILRTIKQKLSRLVGKMDK